MGLAYEWKEHAIEPSETSHQERREGESRRDESSGNSVTRQGFERDCPMLNPWLAVPDPPTDFFDPIRSRFPSTMSLRESKIGLTALIASRPNRRANLCDRFSPGSGGKLSDWSPLRHGRLGKP